MRIKFILIIVVLFFGLAAGVGAAEKVKFISDSIAEKNGKFVRLLGGSSWILLYPSLALVTSEVIIVFKSVTTKDNKHIDVALFYVDGEEIPARYVRGVYAAETGYMTTVVKSFGGGGSFKTRRWNFIVYS